MCLSSEHKCVVIIYGADGDENDDRVFLRKRTPSNRRLHEPEDTEYSPLQPAKLKNKIRDKPTFTITSRISQKNKNEGENARNRF